MKFTQTDNQIIIKQSGGAQLVFGILFALVGGGVIGLNLTGKLQSAAASTNQGSPMVVTLIGLLFLVVGLVVVFAAKSQLTTIVRGGNIDVHSKRLVGGDATDQSFPTSSVMKVRLDTYWQYSTAGPGPQSSPQSQRRSTLSVIMQDQSQLVLATTTRGNFSANGLNVGALMKAPLRTEAEQLAGFLGVPLDGGNVNTILSAVQPVQESLVGPRTPAIQPTAQQPTPEIQPTEQQQPPQA